MYEEMTDDVYAHVGQRMRALRTEKRLTQSHVAKILNVSPQQYQKYEDARSKCSLNYILRLVDYYSVSIDDFLPASASAGTIQQPEPPQVDEQPKVQESPQLEADLLARLVSAYVKLATVDEKLRLVQLVEAMTAREGRAEDV